MTAESLGERLRRLRDSAGLSQDGLGALIGMTGQAIYMIEAGERKRPRKATIEKLSAALGVAPGYLEYGISGAELPEDRYRDEASRILSNLTEPARRAALGHLRLVRELEQSYRADSAARHTPESPESGEEEEEEEEEVDVSETEPQAAHKRTPEEQAWLDEERRRQDQDPA